MELASALRAICKEQDLRPEAIAIAVGVSAQGVQAWTRSKNPSAPSGDTVVRLMRNVPGFAEKLGFTKLDSDVSGAA